MREVKVKADLCWESFNQDGNQQVEENVVSKCHECNEVQGRPSRGHGHAIVQDFIPILLSQDLKAHQRS